MKGWLSRTVLFVLLLTLLIGGSVNALAAEQADHRVVIDFFYGKGCPHCALAEVRLGELQSENPALAINHYEVYQNKENALLFQRYARSLGAEPEGVPTFFINKEIIVGWSDAISATLDKKIAYCMQNECALMNASATNANETNENTTGGDGGKTALTIGAVIGAAAVDAINPCAFAVLIILVATVLARGERKKALLAGLVFSATIFAMYYLMGVGLFTAIQAAGLTRAFYLVVSILALLVGLFNVKDYFWYGQFGLMEVPRTWRPMMKKLLQSVTSVPGAALIAVVVSFFLLPCTSGPYIVILGLLAKTATKSQGALWLLLYNAIFVTPMIVITILVYLGLAKTDSLESKRQSRLKVLHLIAGAIMIVLGVGMLTAMALGML